MWSKNEFSYQLPSYQITALPSLLSQWHVPQFWNLQEHIYALPVILPKPDLT
jgi:hypothetical protein